MADVLTRICRDRLKCHCVNNSKLRVINTTTALRSLRRNTTGQAFCHNKKADIAPDNLVFHLSGGRSRLNKPDSQRERNAAEESELLFKCSANVNVDNDQLLLLSESK